jgi:hypothetical protein
MLSPLPRVYEEGHNGQAVPSEPEPCMIGGDVQVERLTTAATETKKRLEMEVIQPIKQWMVAYRTIHVSCRLVGHVAGLSESLVIRVLCHVLMSEVDALLAHTWMGGA